MGEAFVVNGKNYGYFGFTPALERIVLNRLYPHRHGQWTRLLMLLWAASMVALIVAFQEEFDVSAHPLLLAIAILGSTLLFLCSYAIVYHEALMTGAALALWAYLFFCRYLRRPRIWSLAAACLLSFLSFFARVTVGAGPLLAAAFLCAALLFRHFSAGEKRGPGAAAVLRWLDWLEFPSPAGAAQHAAFLAFCLGVTGATYLSVNHAKFGTWLNPAPLHYHVQYDAERLAKIGGKLEHLSNIPFCASVYFGTGQMELRKSFPWFAFTLASPGPGSGAKLDVLEGHSSIPAAMPALAVLSLLGVFVTAKHGLQLRRRALPIIAAAFLAGCLLLTIGSVTYRYVHDFYPFLIVSAMLGGSGAVYLPEIHSPGDLGYDCRRGNLVHRRKFWTCPPMAARRFLARTGPASSLPADAPAGGLIIHRKIRHTPLQRRRRVGVFPKGTVAQGGRSSRHLPLRWRPMALRGWRSSPPL